MSRKEVSILGRVAGLGPTPQPALLSLVLCQRALEQGAWGEGCRRVWWGRGRGRPQWVWRLPLSLCLLGPLRVETFTSENNELWKKVETLENANRWVASPASSRAAYPSAASAWLWHRSEGGREMG